MYFTFDNSIKIKKKYGQFDIITANHVCAHVEDLNDFFQSIPNLLKKKGMFIFEVSYLGSVIKKKHSILYIMNMQIITLYTH